MCSPDIITTDFMIHISDTLRIKKKPYVAIWLLVVLLNTTIFAGSHHELHKSNHSFWYYHGLDYGSESCLHPLRTIINGGFGIMQIHNRSTRLADVDYATGWRNITSNILHPWENIRQYGTGTFFITEVIPSSLKTTHAQWFPNYQLHVIGGGMTYRSMLEWYRYHGTPFPRTHALVSWSIYHFLNEVVENNNFNGTNVDAIADLLIFNPLGLLLFQFDPINRFFGHTMHMRDWSFQPMYAPANGTIENNGQNFCISHALPGSRRWHWFYFFGVHGSIGLMYRTDSGGGLSIGAGLKANELITTYYDNNTRSMTTSFLWTAGVFYDRNYSLLASYIYSQSKSYRHRLNIYPGLFRYGRFSPGLFCAVGQHRRIVWGIHLPAIPMGFAVR